MGFSDFFQGQNDQYQQQSGNQASITHELLGGAAAFEAAKAYENHVAANGEPSSHATRNEILAGFAGAFIDREAETRGLDFIDREKAKREAQNQLQQQF
ncbi:uncharacterized protein EHS24_008894 [Apiotrichum porosum]|uniref:Phosphoglycerate mutase family protein n=1 Tax=Apiotrichum porosum TaxID=105984 RepID=A0A427XNF8_9TREE|nr:uncharacterized protein EHS24_008894 [Apiotrichum porosum]RSH80318.1 hypothetical protein EHS24_008894 [Apiotrichum porosum]